MTKLSLSQRALRDYLSEGMTHQLTHRFVSERNLERAIFSPAMKWLHCLFGKGKRQGHRREEFPGKGDTEGATLVFPGWQISLETLQALYDVLGEDGPVIVHQLPTDLIHEDAGVAWNAYRDLYHDKVRKDPRIRDVRRVVGFSLGTTLAFKTANDIAKENPSQLEELIAIQAGRGIDTAVSRAAVTQYIVRRGIRKQMENVVNSASSPLAALRRMKRATRDEVGLVYDPINNLEGLAQAGTPVKIHEGMADDMIPPARKQLAPLVRSMDAAGVHYELLTYQDEGHYGIMRPVIRAHRGRLQEQMEAPERETSDV